MKKVRFTETQIVHILKQHQPTLDCMYDNHYDDVIHDLLYVVDIK